MKNKILIINGSAQEPLLNERYLSFIERVIKKEEGFEAKNISLRSLGLPLFLGNETSRGKTVEKWREVVEWADGFIIASPEYDHALPAVLKNSFEHLDGKGYRDKPVMLIGATPGQFGTVQAQHSIYPILRTYGAWLVPDEVFIPRADKKIDGDDKITDETVSEKISSVTISFLRSVEVLQQLRR